MPALPLTHPCIGIDIPSPKILPVFPVIPPHSDTLKSTNSSRPDTNTIKDDTLPAYLQSFHNSGISEARLKRFSWLHPKNYSEDGSLSDDYRLSIYGTSVSSPRGDDWEIVDRGPRKSIDMLWNEVFEHQQRKKLIEQIHQVQAQAAFQLRYPNPQHQVGQSQVKSEESMSEYGGSSETSSSPISMSMSSVSDASSILAFSSMSLPNLGQIPMTQVDKTPVHAISRTDRGSAIRRLHSAIRTFS